MQDSHYRRKLALEMEQRAHGGLVGVDVIERTHEELVKQRLRVFWLDGRFSELAAVSGKQCAAITFSQPFAPIMDHHLTQCVQLSLERRLKTDFAAKKKIEPSCKGAARPARAFGNGLDEAM